MKDFYINVIKVLIKKTMNSFEKKKEKVIQFFFDFENSSFLVGKNKQMLSLNFFFQGCCASPLQNSLSFLNKLLNSLEKKKREGGRAVIKYFSIFENSFFLVEKINTFSKHRVIVLPHSRIL